MPTYDYRCEACNHEFEELQQITAKPLKKCPACGKMKLVRLIGMGGGVIFKGSGFYATDYASKTPNPKPKSKEQNAPKSNLDNS